MSIFIEAFEKLEAYRKDKRILEKLQSKFVFLNKQEFVDWYEPVNARTSKRLGLNRDEDNEVSKCTANENMIETLTNEVCREGVADDYVDESINDTLSFDDPSFDLLVVVQSDYYAVSNLNTTTSVSKKKLAKIEGFMVTETGECKLYPNSIAVKLICSRERDSNDTLKGIFKSYYLLGALMCCVKDNPNYDQTIVLELASKYKNLSGFFAYTKVGFDRNDTLYNSDCFYEKTNLPMSVDLRKYDVDTIISFSTNNKSRTDINDPTGLYEFGTRISKKDQETLAKYANWLFEIQVAKSEPMQNRGYRQLVKGFDKPNQSAEREKKLKKIIIQVNNSLRNQLNGKSTIKAGSRLSKKKKYKKKRTLKRRTNKPI